MYSSTRKDRLQPCSSIELHNAGSHLPFLRAVSGQEWNGFEEPEIMEHQQAVVWLSLPLAVDATILLNQAIPVSALSTFCSVN